MVDLMHELDHGPAALPPGSTVTLLNTRPCTDTMGGHACTCCRHIEVGGCTVIVAMWGSGIIGGLTQLLLVMR